MPKFKLPKAQKGQQIVADRYIFEDGILRCSDSVAVKLEKILVRYYGCELLPDDEQPVTDEKPAETGSLAVEKTKTEDGKAQK